MRVVIHDNETLEPLTVVTMPRDYIDRLHDESAIYLAVPIDKNADIPVDYKVTSYKNVDYARARVFANPFRRIVEKGGEPRVQIGYLYLTDTPELILKIKSTFLPGQWSNKLLHERA